MNAPVIQQVQVVETTWLEGIIHVDCQPAPNGGRVLLYTLGNGHRYAIPLVGPLLDHTRRLISPVAVVGANALTPSPNNSHGA